MRVLGQGRPESLSVLARAGPDSSLEGSAHDLGPGEAAAPRDLLEGGGARLEVAPRPLDAKLLDVVARCGSEFPAEDARELPLGEMQPAGQGGDGEVLVEVLRDPGLQIAQGLALGELVGELDRELGLPTGPAGVDHEHAGGLQGDLTAEVLLGECQREIHSRRDAGRGVDVAVADEDGVGIDVDVRIALGQPGAARPMSCRPAPVEQARLGEQEGPGADGRRPARLRRDPGRRRRRDRAPRPSRGRRCRRERRTCRRPGPTWSRRASARKVSPLLLRTSRPSAVTQTSSGTRPAIRPAVWRTSHGPVMSSASTPS